MSKGRKITSEDPIWEVIRHTQQENHRVVEATHDPFVQEVLGLFIECDFDDPTVEKDCKRALRRYVVNVCGVAPNQCDNVFSLTENVLLQEPGASNGQA